MVLLIAGGTHTGKTLLAQKMLERYHYPAFSLDHLKMGLIRSGHCPLTPESADAELTQYLWPIVREMIRTALENKQNMVVEGCYIPFDYRDSFTPLELQSIRYVCLVFSERYVREHYGDIFHHANCVEQRLADVWIPLEQLLEENRANLGYCKQFGHEYILIDNEYRVDWQPLGR